MSTNRVRTIYPIAALALLLIIACGGDDATGPADPGTREPVWSVAVEPEQLALTVGQTRRVTARLYAKDGSPLSGRTVSWTSSSAPVAEIDGSGVITARREGSVVLTARSEGREGRATLTVAATPVPVASIEIRPAGVVTVGLGDSVRLAAVLRAADGTELSGRVLTWAVAPAQNATVDSNGVVVTRFAGTVVVTATSEGRTAQKAITVSAAAIAVARVEPTTDGVVTLAAGGTTQLGVRTYAADGTELLGRTTTWASSNTAVASVSPSGIVSAHAVGSADVAAEVEGRRATVSIDVRSLVARIDLDAADLVFAPGEHHLVQATARSADGAILERSFTWRSDDPDVARVDATGRITAAGVGGTVVRVITEGVEGRLDVRVVEWASRPLLTIEGSSLPAVLFTRIESTPEGGERRIVAKAHQGELQLALTGMNAGRYRLLFSVTVTTDGGAPTVGQYVYGGTWRADIADGTLLLNGWNGETLEARRLAGGALAVSGRLEGGMPALELVFGGG